MKLKTGDRAPNFDLSSTEGVLLMLCDEVPRSPLLLAFVAAAEAGRETLRELAARHADFTRRGLKVLVVSSDPLAELQALQQELELPFPLLHDDRGFSKLYGFDPAEDGAAQTLLVLVDQGQRVLLVADGQASLETALANVLSEVDRLPSSSVNYPRTVINRLVDRWVS